MARVLALVEGPTERNFGQKLLAPHLGLLGIEYHPRVVGKPGHKGGAGAWERVKREILGLIRQEPSSTVTTMFDFYALPGDWPGRQEARDKGLQSRDAVELIEEKIGGAIAAEFANAGFVPRFIPYLSLHEYEALLFSNPPALASVTQGTHHAQQFQAVLDECGECEKIDDHPATAPSKRIMAIAPGYEKTVDGITVAERMGLQVMREKCPHFNAWLARLEAISP